MITPELKRQQLGKLDRCDLRNVVNDRWLITKVTSTSYIIQDCWHLEYDEIEPRQSFSSRDEAKRYALALSIDRPVASH